MELFEQVKIRIAKQKLRDIIPIGIFCAILLFLFIGFCINGHFSILLLVLAVIGIIYTIVEYNSIRYHREYVELRRQAEKFGELEEVANMISAMPKHLYLKDTDLRFNSTLLFYANSKTATIISPKDIIDVSTSIKKFRGKTFYSVNLKCIQRIVSIEVYSREAMSRLAEELKELYKEHTSARSSDKSPFRGSL